ncbi:MAG: hypothetical protein EPN84_12030 [Legionella sp.]|nr:MAG: hypothetical protein EPN84_12030 [Legionella sp.]
MELQNNRRFFYKWILGMIGLALSTVMYATILSAKSSQSVKLKSPIKNTLVSVSGIESTISDCGPGCQLINLLSSSTHPQGKLTIDLHTNRGCHSQFSASFEEKNGTLSTETGIFMIAICEDKFAEFEILQNLNSKGYLINIYTDENITD